MLTVEIKLAAMTLQYFINFIKSDIFILYIQYREFLQLQLSKKLKAELSCEY